MIAAVASIVLLVSLDLAGAVHETDRKLNALLERLDAAKGDLARLELIKQIAGLKSPKAAAALSVEVSNDQNSEAARLEALKGLEALNTPVGNDAIALAALKSDSDAVRARAIEAIGNLRVKEFTPACVRGLSSDVAPIRKAAVEALVKFDDLQLTVRILPALKDEDPRVRSAARRGLSEFHVRRALYVLFRASKPMNGKSPT